MTAILSRPRRGGLPRQIPKILPAASPGGPKWAPKCVFGKNMHMLGRAQSLCLGTFTVISSSQNFFPSLLDMTRKDFRVPGPGSIAKMEI